MARLLMVNGPNLNLVGRREPEVYGTDSLEKINERLGSLAADLGLELVFFQANGEGELIDFIQREAGKAEGLIINPGAFTHYSYALRDVIAATEIEAIEVHLSNIFDREEFRRHSVIAPVCRGMVTGFGFYGYAMALSYFADTANDE
jgi:3-dehydroquinate dehydratase-2